MIRSVSVFLFAFLAGAAVALVARTVRHAPHADAPEPPLVLEQAPMVSNALVPPAPTAAAAPQPPETHAHAHAPAASATSATTPVRSETPTVARPVNTICAICGMDVDPSLPTEQYQGHTIGFGCRACPPKFRAEPDKYGPAYVRNELHAP
ncbi:hypothetical protein ASA1KI_00290 [Opitutales bacterium ASA1]|uniref:hypothetical protein n=1 Tax=Congregicoccus parvus TaxID=3081749 RepID=UPI002B2F7AF9|nr:hypothetical protein ASA1KI_00290 [Opitutales bacterium ASA1]